MRGVRLLDARLATRGLETELLRARPACEILEAMATANVEPLSGAHESIITLLSGPDLPIDLIRSAPELALRIEARWSG